MPGKLANFGLQLLLLMSFAWGGCLSCSQAGLFSKSHGGCCDPAGHCGKLPRNAPASRACDLKPVALASAADDASVSPVLPVAVASPVTPAAAPSAFAAPESRLGPPQASPPDLYLLHSTFRI